MQSVDQEALCQSAAHYSPAQQAPACISEIPHTVPFILTAFPLFSFTCLVFSLTCHPLLISLSFIFIFTCFFFSLSPISSPFFSLMHFYPPVHPSSLSTHPSFHIMPLALSFIKAHSRKCESHI